MNAADALNVNRLMVWLLEFADDDAEVPSCEQARDAAAALAESALAASGTGICGDEVRAAWHWSDDGYDLDEDERYVPIVNIDVAGERL